MSGSYGLMINEEVLSKMATMAATEIPGVRCISAKATNIKGVVARGGFGKSVKAKVATNGEVTINVFISVKRTAKVKELAQKVNLSSTPVFERQRRLEGSGYIKKYMAVLDAEKLNRGFVVFCNVKMKQLNREIAHDFMRIIQEIPEVTECYNISGSFDYLLKIHAPDMKYYQEFVLNVLGTIDHLGSLESTFVMSEVKHTYGINV